MKIDIYLGPIGGGVVDASDVDKGNPGVGGTQYCMLELAHYLNCKKNYEITLLAARRYILEDGINFVQVNGDDDVCSIVNNTTPDFFILSQFNNKQLEADIKQLNINVIIWCHNYIYSDFCDFIVNTECIKANVFVGKQQYDRYIDDDVIKKSTFIYNMFVDNTPNVERENDSMTVVYMGALIEGKGFVDLCKIWHYVLKKVPNAKLLVLGKGNLYGNRKMGSYGLASESYEKQFSKYITDSAGNIIPSVKFLGVVGKGKTEIFRKASIGVVNPSGRTETFGMGVVEMAEAKLPVVTIGKNGYFDTIINNVTGVLSPSLKQMAIDIVDLLKDVDRNETYGETAKQRISRFHPNIIGPQWEKLLHHVSCENANFTYLKASHPYSNNIKWVRLLLRWLRFDLHISFFPSLIKIESTIVKIFYK